MNDLMEYAKHNRNKLLRKIILELEGMDTACLEDVCSIIDFYRRDVYGYEKPGPAEG